MKFSRIPKMTIFVAAVVGCEATMPTDLDRSEVNSCILGSIKDTAINNAIISQRALFPYHFVPNAAVLNELGKRDLGVLAVHYKDHPGKLTVRQGNASRELYLARLHTVVEALADAGVAPKRVNIADNLAGGSGMPSEQVRKIMEGGDSQAAPLRRSEQGSGPRRPAVSGRSSQGLSVGGR